MYRSTNAGTPGKSGSLFFFSEDMRFIVKTLPKREAKMLIEILPAYYQVLADCSQVDVQSFRVKKCQRVVFLTHVLTLARKRAWVHHIVQPE